MNWKFWTHGSSSEGAPKEQKLSRPKPLPEMVGRRLVVDFKKDPDLVWKLMGVVLPRSESRHRYDFRLFAPIEASTRGVPIKNYHSLDDHPELILYEGWFDKSTHESEIIDKRV